MELKNFADFLDRQSWIFAKTYTKSAPHEYIVRNKLDESDISLFSEVVTYIRSHGFPALFGGYEHIYFYYDGHYYWTIGNPVEKTIILNRCDYKLYEMRYSGNGGEGCSWKD